jgi:hypothetical protein
MRLKAAVDLAHVGVPLRYKREVGVPQLALGTAPFASKEQRGERQQNYSERCAASSQALVKNPRAVDAERRHLNPRPRSGPSCRSATRPSRYVAAGRSRRSRAWRPLGRR